MTMTRATDQLATGKIKPSYGYYRQPNGWITVSPAAELDELHYRRRRWEPLIQYGRFEMSTPYAANHPLEALFMLGGAHELSREQIIESGLHLNPPLIPSCRTPANQYHPQHNANCMSGATPVVFPQLTAEDMVAYPCRFCEASKPTEKARNQHETVMHKDEKSDIRTGQALSDGNKELISGLINVLRPGSPESDESNVLKVLESVGLNKGQRRALEEAGLLPKSEEANED